MINKITKNGTRKNAVNASASPVPKRHYRLHIYKENEAPFDAVLNAVDLGFLQMVEGKKYTLKQIVELGTPGLWSTMNHYTRRCMGALFAAKYYKDTIHTVRMIDVNQSPIRYLSD